MLHFDRFFSTHKRLLCVLFLSCLPVVFIGCSGSGDDGAPADPDSSDIPATDIPATPAFDPNEVIPEPSVDALALWLLNQSDFSIFLTLIEEADLANALIGDNDGNQWTVFAPTNSAFDNVDLDMLDDTQRLALPKLHVHSGLIESADFVAGELSMLEGSVSITIGSDGVLQVGGARIVARDRRVSNGVVHVIGSVMSASAGP